MVARSSAWHAPYLSREGAPVRVELHKGRAAKRPFVRAIAARETEVPMPQYIALIDWTDQGVRSFKESVDRY